MKRFAVVCVAASMLAGLFAVPAFASAPKAAAAPKSVAAPQQLSPISIVGQCTNSVTGAVGTFTGTLSVKRFFVQNGKLMAAGLLSGSCSVDGSITDVPVALPVAIPQSTCTILTLNLGPLHLDLLGLVIDLSPVNLVITAVSGPGNLLGNLLCGIAHLLDNGGSLGSIAALLDGVLYVLK